MLNIVSDLRSTNAVETKPVKERTLLGSLALYTQFVSSGCQPINTSEPAS